MRFRRDHLGNHRHEAATQLAVQLGRVDAADIGTAHAAIIEVGADLIMQAGPLLQASALLVEAGVIRRLGQVPAQQGLRPD